MGFVLVMITLQGGITTVAPLDFFPTWERCETARTAQERDPYANTLGRTFACRDRESLSGK
jgi:hypothetical protein